MDKLADACAYLADKDNDPAAFAARLKVAGRAHAQLLLAVVDAPEKRARNRAVKLLAELAAAHPEHVYPDTARLVEWSNSGETILKWNALIALGHLARVDRDGVIEATVPSIVKQLGDESMITAGHAIACLGRIAAAIPTRAKKIIEALTGLEIIPREAACRQILLGKTLDALDEAWPALSPVQRKTALAFAKPHLNHPHPGTAKLAAKCLKRWGKSGNG